MRLAWLLLAVLPLQQAYAITLNELLEKHGKKTVLDSILRKTGKRAHIKTEDGIKLFNLPNVEFTDVKTMQRDLAVFNLTPEQIDQDIIASQQQQSIAKQQLQYDQDRYAALPPPPPAVANQAASAAPSTGHQGAYPIYLPRYHGSRHSYRRSSRRHR